MTLAGEALATENYRQAFEHYRMAEFQLEQADRQNGAADDPMARLKTETQNYLDLKKRTTQAVAGCPELEAQRLYQQAEDLETDIEALSLPENAETALNQYYQATRLLLRAVDLCRGYTASPYEKAVEEVELLGNLLQTLAQTDNTALRQARQLYDQARDDIVAEDYDAALEKAQTAQALIGRRLQQGNPMNKNRRIEQEFRRLENELTRLQQQNLDAQYQSFLKAAEQSVQDARDDIKSGQFPQALQSAAVAKRFIKLAAGELPIRQANPTEVRTSLRRVGIIVQRRPQLQNRPVSSRYYERAQLAAANQQYEVAMEYIRIIQNAVRMMRNQQRGGERLQRN